MKKRIIITGGSGFIGTNVVQFYLDKNWDVLNLDCRAPRNIEHSDYFKETDILVPDELERVINNFNPDYIIHLAARTDLNESNDINGYNANIVGVRNIISTCNNCKNLKRIIFASSMLVCRLGYLPKDEFDYQPDTLYGRSKVLTEKIIHGTSINSEWLIVRPTSIWGPWFDVPYKNFFDAVLGGLFFHPGTRSGTCTYGFIGNTVYQINQLLVAEMQTVHGRIFYLGDSPPNNLSEWANEIAETVGLRKIKTVPYWISKVAASVGDFLKLLRVPFPLTSFRLKNMTTNNILDLYAIHNLVPNPPYSRKEGIQITIDWMRR